MSILDDLNFSDPKTREFMDALLGQKVCAESGCTQKTDLRPWPPDKADAPKYCGVHRFKRAAKP